MRDGNKRRETIKFSLRSLTLVNIVVQFLLALSLLPFTVLLPLFVTNFSLAMHILQLSLGLIQLDTQKN